MTHHHNWHLVDQSLNLNQSEGYASMHYNYILFMYYSEFTKHLLYLLELKKIFFVLKIILFLIIKSIKVNVNGKTITFYVPLFFSFFLFFFFSIFRRFVRWFTRTSREYFFLFGRIDSFPSHFCSSPGFLREEERRSI